MPTSNANQTDPTHPTVSRLTRWWRNWVGNRAGQAELNKLGSQELGHIARDIGASSGELTALAGKWPDSADLLARRMAALHLDPAAIARSQPALSRDMKKLCSLCGYKGWCEYDLDARAVNPRWRGYCPNSTTLTALIPERSAYPQKDKG